MSILYISLDATINNFGGSAKNIGNIQDGVQNTLGLVNLVGYESYDHPHSSSPLENKDTKKAAIEPSVFCYNNSRPVIKGYTKVLNNFIIALNSIGVTGTADTSLTSGIHPRTTNTNRSDTSAIRNNLYNLSTGKFDANLPVIYNDSFGVDNAVSVDRNNPGTLNFRLARNNQTKMYKSKTG